MTKRSATVTAAWISAVALILAAIIGAIAHNWPRSADAPHHLYVAGTVVDELTNSAIGQASIAVTGRSETYVTDDSGNFRLDFSGEVPDRLRIRVTKPGYKPYDERVKPPVDNYIVQLRRQ